MDNVCWLNRRDGYDNVAFVRENFNQNFRKALKNNRFTGESEMNFTLRFCFVLFRLSKRFNPDFNAWVHSSRTERRDRDQPGRHRREIGTNQFPSERNGT